LYGSIQLKSYHCNMSWTNYHSHCHYCDGKEAPRAHVESAIQKGIYAFGFSSHAPVPFHTTWCMPLEKATNYTREIAQIKQEYAKTIQIYAGLEVDYIPGTIGPNNRFIKNLGLDYTIGSVHFVDSFSDDTPWEIDGQHKVFLYGLSQIFNGNIKLAVSRYFELTRRMLEEDCPDVLGHLDKIKIQHEQGELFSEDETWYKQEVMRTLKVIAKNKVTVEVNTRGIYKKKTPETYPSRWILEHMHEMGIPVQINADAHHPDELTKHFSQTAAMLKEIGFKYLKVLADGKWQSLPFSEKGVEF